MKSKRNALHASPRQRARPVLREVAHDPALGPVISVRAAKAHLSALLDVVSAGREIIITSGGQPKVRLVAFHQSPKRKVFGGAERHLASMPAWKDGPTADEIIRADRDARGW